MTAAFYWKPDAYLNELDSEWQAKFLLTAETCEKTVQVISTETKYDPYFNVWVRKRFANGCGRNNDRLLIGCFLKLDWMKKFRSAVQR
jgi:hypothetical protein